MADDQSAPTNDEVRIALKTNLKIMEARIKASSHPQKAKLVLNASAAHRNLASIEHILFGSGHITAAGGIDKEP
jgi:hypothetical protein